jgi:hypothetical protein
MASQLEGSHDERLHEECVCSQCQHADLTQCINDSCYCCDLEHAVYVVNGHDPTTSTTSR